MALKPDGSSSGMRFGARLFKPAVAIDFERSSRFAQELRRRFLFGEAAGAMADRIFADPDGAVVSVRSQIDVGIKVDTASSPEQPHHEVLPRRQLPGEHVHTRSERVVVHDREAARMLPAERFHRTMRERFTRVEHAAAVLPARPGPAQPATLPGLRESSTGPSPSAPLVLHRPKPETVTVEAPVIRQLSASLQPEKRPRISAKEIGYLADEVISRLNRQSIAWRERFGRS